MTAADLGTGYCAAVRQRVRNPEGMNVSVAELVLEQTVQALDALALQLVVHGDHVAVEFLHVLPELEHVLHAADGHAAHRSPEVILGHILERVLVGIGADGHVEHQRVHVDEGVQAPAVVGPGAPVGIIKRCTGPGNDAMTGLREGIDLLAHALLEDLANLLVGDVPDLPITVLCLIDAVQSLGNTVNRIVVGLADDFPLLPLKALQLVLELQLVNQLLPAEGDVVLFLYKLPEFFDLSAAVGLDQRIVEEHRHRQGEQRLVEEPVLQRGGGDWHIGQGSPGRPMD